MIFSSKIQEMTNCSREIKPLTRDQMMLGGYIYDDFGWLEDSVFCNCVIQLNSQFHQTLIFYLTLLENISERNSILQDKIFLQQNVNNKKPEKKKQPARKHQ